MTEMDKLPNKNIVVAMYGHTSWLDSCYYLYCGIFMPNNVSILVKKKYKFLYPNYFHKFLYFIDTNTTKMIHNGNIALLIEGSRSYKNYIHSGFKYIAKNNNCEIVFGVIDFHQNKIYFTNPIGNDLSNTEYENYLTKFVQNFQFEHISLYPNYCSKIKIRQKHK